MPEINRCPLDLQIPPFYLKTKLIGSSVYAELQCELHRDSAPDDSRGGVPEYNLKII